MRNFAFAAVLALCACSGATQPSGGAPDRAPARAAVSSDVCNAYRAQSQRVEVTASGTVVKVLGIRRGPSGVHEGFLLATDPASGCRLTLRIEHNLDIAGRVPLERGEPLELRGEYIYDSRGGIVHWTHRDPRGRHPGGYIKANGEVYQ
jgi:hypothetical protein